MSSLETKPETRFYGVGVSPGIARAKIHVVRDDEEEITQYSIAPAEITGEIGRFEAALIQTRAQILEVQQKIAEAIGAKDAGIFDAHLLVVEDRTLIDEVLRKLESDLCNVEYIFHEVASRYAETLSKIDDPYLRERALDIQDVMRRVIRNLLGKAPKAAFLGLKEPHILVAHNITPSDTATMDREQVLGFATDLGSRTSHTAIMARSMTIPAIVGLHDVTEKLESGEEVLLDGYNGVLILNPTPETLWHYGELQHRQDRVAQQLTGLRETKSTTKDGRHIVLSANIELPKDVESVLANGAEGIGLYRTEFLYLNRPTLPSDDEQFEIYRSVAASVAPHSLIIRTFDLGGDKIASHLDSDDEQNPFLGLRAIRFSLENLDIFKTQLCAILRASAAGNVKIMFPMISGVQELRRALAVLEECKEELKQKGIPFGAKTEVGAMIEIPSAALCAESLAREVDFFSIGTNDLIQYAVAVDRLNERIAHLYEPTHPAVIRLLKMVADAAHANNIWAGVCGEMAGDLTMVPLLLGLGMDELSVSASLVPRVKRAVQSLSLPECQQLVTEALKLDTPSEILARCGEVAQARYGDLIG